MENDADELLVASMQALEKRQNEVEAAFVEFLRSMEVKYSPDAIAERVDAHIVERRRNKISAMLQAAGLKADEEK